MKVECTRCFKTLQVVNFAAIPKCCGQDMEVVLYKENTPVPAPEGWVSIDMVVERLNELLKIDPQAINTLFQVRAICNEKIGMHPGINVLPLQTEKTIGVVGIIGILSGLFGVDKEGFPRLCLLINDDNEIVAFAKYEKPMRDVSKAERSGTDAAGKPAEAVNESSHKPEKDKDDLPF